MGIRQKIWKTMLSLKHGAAVRGPTILVYHRIGDSRRDPWKLSVSPRHFEQHLHVISKSGLPVSLSTLCGALSERILDPRWVAVTFDDGYADNLDIAAPLLGEYGIPATFFVTSGQLGSRYEFWWDELERIVLESGGQILAKIRRNRAESGSQIYDRLWKELSSLSEQRRRARLDELSDVAGVSTGKRASYSSLTKTQLKALSEFDLVEIGAHTVTHPNLSQLSEKDQHYEVMECRNDLARILGAEPRHFSYPHGACSDVTIGKVRDAGYAFGFGLSGQRVTVESNQLCIPRVMVGNWAAPRFSAWLGRSIEA